MKKTFSKKGNIVDILNRRVFFGEIFVEDGIIKKIEKIPITNDLTREERESYIMPGFVDAHVHIESSMLIPSRFAALAVSHGVIAVVTDPHEIANVLGVDGINFMIEDSKKVPLKFYFGASSCVPATPFETSGAVLDAETIDKLLQRDDIYFLSEVMNFPGVINKDPEVMKKIESAIYRDKPIDGHAPGLKGEDLKKYVEAAISTDHEAYTLEEAEEKISLGMKIQIREGSAAKNFEALHPLIEKYPDMLMFCTDDSHPDDLRRRYIEAIVYRAIEKGYDFMDVLQIATVNPVLHYGLDVGLLREGDPADFIVLENLFFHRINEVYINGNLVYKEGKLNFELPPVPNPINKFNAEKIGITELKVKAKSNKINVIQAIDGELITKKLVLNPKVEDGFVVPDIENDILKIVVLNRYQKAKPVVGFIKGFGLKKGAIATTVAHDSHNIIAVGTDDLALMDAINKIIELKGGLVVTDGNEIKFLQLEIAGLMSSTSEPEKIGVLYSDLNDFAKKELGTKMKAPFMTLSFMALLVIPELKIGDKGLFDVSKFNFVDLFV